MRRLWPIIILVVALLLPLTISARENLVVYWGFDINEIKDPAVLDAIKAFETKNNISISFVKRSELYTEDLHDVYSRLLSSKSAVPDIMEIDGIRVPEFASMKYIADITKYVPKGELARFFENGVKEVTWEGKLYGYPFFTAWGLLIYKKDIISKPPDTWDELIRLAQEYQREGLYGYAGQMASYEGFTCNALEFIWSNGGDPNFSSTNDVFSLRDAESLQIMVDIVNKYKLTPPEQLQFAEFDGIQLLRDEKVIFLRNWPKAMLKLRKLGSPSEFKYGIAPIPKGPRGDKGHSMFGGWTLVINNNSKHVEIAQRLLELLTGEVFQKYVVMHLNHLPALKSLYEDKDILTMYPWLNDAYPLIANSKLRPRSPYYPEISRIIQGEFHLALENKISAREAIERTNKKLRSFFKTAGKWQ